jgi:NTE family protein
MPQDKRERALVLSGGGGRGAYHVGVLRYLEERDWTPDIIVGTSIGAVNGAALASGHDATSLWELWRNLETSQVQRPQLNILMLDRWRSVLDTAPLRETLLSEGWIYLDRVNAPEPPKHLRITAVEAATGRLRIFGNSPDVQAGPTEQCTITVDHILASCSIPVVYPPTEIGGTLYWDGGTVANTPLRPAVDAGAQDIVVVMMTPWEYTDPADAASPRGLLDAAAMAFEWALLASFQAEWERFHRTNDLLQLGLENARLRLENARLRVQLGIGTPEDLIDADGDGVPDVFQREIGGPLVVAPEHLLPITQIVHYDPDTHERLYHLGYEDARRAWEQAPRKTRKEHE